MLCVQFDRRHRLVALPDRYLHLEAGFTATE